MITILLRHYVQNSLNLYVLLDILKTNSIEKEVLMVNNVELGLESFAPYVILVCGLLAMTLV